MPEHESMNPSERMLDFEVKADGSQVITIGNSYGDLERTMERYYPNQSERDERMRLIFKWVVDTGLLNGKRIRVSQDTDLSDEALAREFPGEPTIDLSDEALAREFPNLPVNGPEKGDK